MRAAAVAAALAAALSALSWAGCVDLEPLPEEAALSSEVTGGEAAPAGQWPDVAAVLISGQAQCSGVLIAPTVALTAGHCNQSGLQSILVGTTSLARPSEGETLSVVKRIEYPDSQQTEDLTVLVLGKASRFKPRAIASGWAGAEIRNGAVVDIVGYGAIDRDAMMYVNDLQQAETTVTDADCTQKLGCNAAVSPGGELGAGGMGIDSCRGDSGGPLYLPTSFGTFVAGITSRSYDDATFPCSQGGIYARPGKVADWIEQAAGVKISRGPEPRFDSLSAVRGFGAETSISVNDPASKRHSFAIAAQPAHGTARVRDDGRVRVCTDPAAEPGGDAVVVTITDRANSIRKLDVEIPIEIEGGDPGVDCSVDDFDGGGCCDSGRSARGSLPLGLGVLVVLRRRRRRRAILR